MGQKSYPTGNFFGLLQIATGLKYVIIPGGYKKFLEKLHYGMRFAIIIPITTELNKIKEAKP